MTNLSSSVFRLPTRRIARAPGLYLVLAAGAALLGMLGPSPAAAQDRVVPDNLPERPRVPIWDPGQPFLDKTLKNGVRLMVQEQRTVASMAGVVAFRMGTRYEDEENSGLGNLLLQSMVKGTTKSTPSEFLVRMRGNNVGMAAEVGPDVGLITVTSDKEHSLAAAALLADVVLSPALADTSVESARVTAGSNAAYDTESPIPIAYGEYIAAMYAGTPYTRPIHGLVTPVSQARRSDMLALHRKIAAGSNVTVVFVGNLDGKKLMTQLEKAFATATPGPALVPTGPEPQPLAADIVVTKEKPWRANACVIGFPAPGYTDPDYPAFAMISSYLESEDRSPLLYWMAMREDAVSPGIVYPLLPARSSVAIYFGATSEKLPAARDTTLAVFQRLRREPLGPGEWTVQLKRVQNGYFFKQEEPLVRAKMISKYVAQGLSADYPRQFELALLKLTPEDVRAAADRWLTHSCQVYLGPSSVPASDAKP